MDGTGILIKFIQLILATTYQKKARFAICIGFSMKMEEDVGQLWL